MNLFFKILFLTLINQYHAQNIADDNQRHEVPIIERVKFLSDLQSEYLNVVKHFWIRIEHDLNLNDADDKNNTIIDILKVHKEIFFGETRETTSYWRSYLILGIDKLRDRLTAINSTLDENYGFLYDASERIVFESSKIEQWTRESMFRRLQESIDGLFDITVHSDNVMQHIKTEAKSCTRYVKYVVSEIQLVREYYANVAKSLLRSHAMSQLAYMLLTLTGNGNYQQQSEVERNFFIEQCNKFYATIEGMLHRASRDLWKCNPNPYLDNHSYYTSVTNFLQGYIDNEVNMNPDQSCSNSCSDFKQTKNYECNNQTVCAHNNFKKTKCSGEIFDCDVITADGTVCLVTDEIENRRYNFIKFKNGSMNGHDVMCFRAEKTELSVWSTWLINECSNCFCYCDEPGEKSDRYFSLREIVSDINENKIVTGISLQKINRVIQFVISERDLFENGKVNDTYRRLHTWKNDIYPFALSTDKQNNVDYHTLSREHRSINLDTIVLPPTKLVTGVRFKLYENRLTLEIRATEFDYATGKLRNLENSVWLNNLNGKENKRTELEIDNADSPTRTTNIQEPFDSANKYIVFRQSDIKKDLAQVTIPYIETVYLEASEPRPLSGAGIYYKGEVGYGGFVAIKLIAYDYGETLKPSKP